MLREVCMFITILCCISNSINSGIECVYCVLALSVWSVYWHASGYRARPPNPFAHLWDELIVVGQVCSAVDAAVGAVAVGQVGLEGFRLGHLYHLTVVILLAGLVCAGAGWVAALLNLLTEETLEDASKSRRCCGVGVWHAPHKHHGRKNNLGRTTIQGVGERERHTHRQRKRERGEEKKLIIDLLKDYRVKG